MLNKLLRSKDNSVSQHSFCCLPKQNRHLYPRSSLGLPSMPSHCSLGPLLTHSLFSLPGTFLLLQLKCPPPLRPFLHPCSGSAKYLGIRSEPWSHADEYMRQYDILQSSQQNQPPSSASTTTLPIRTGLFYCTSLYCTSQVLCSLQTEGKTPSTSKKIATHFIRTLALLW